MSGSALEGGAVFEGEGQAAIRVGRGVVQQAAPERQGMVLCAQLFVSTETVPCLSKFGDQCSAS